MSRLRKTLSLVLAAALTITTVACSEGPEQRSRSNPATTQTRDVRIADGQYQVQQATYDDGNGLYTVLLLGTPPGSPSSIRTDQLQLARLTEEAIKQGKQSYLEVKGGQPALYLTPDFKIEYVHNVTETRTDPATGQPQTVVVRQESSFWTPFAASLAGAAVGNLLFAPRYYMPPVYSPGGLYGYGSYGNTYGQAVQGYQSRYNTLPPSVRNSTAVRNTGTSFGSRSTRDSTRATGRGFGGSTLQPDSSGSTYNRNRSRSGFGSFGSRSRSFGRRR